jgi:hypothetical protein
MHALRMALEKTESGEAVSISVITFAPTRHGLVHWAIPRRERHRPVAARRDIGGELILDTSHRGRRI